MFYARFEISAVCISLCQLNGQDEDGDNEISTVEAEEKWSKRTREGH